MRFSSRLIRSRRGDEFVEAALVLPVLILAVLSMIMLILYFYLCLNTQTGLHENLMEKTAESKAVFWICTESDSVSSQMDGITHAVLKKNITGRMYVLDYAEIIRAGELIASD